MPAKRDDYNDAEWHTEQAALHVNQVWHSTTNLDYDAALQSAQIARGMLTAAEYHLARCRDEQNKRQEHDHE